MNNDRTDAIRNLALIGPAGTGKTSLAEALLHAAGAIKQRGRTERGDTVCDYDPREVALGHSLETAICQLEWQATRVNFIDTPGFTDFLPRAFAVLPAVESAALVLSASGGLETGVRRMMKAAGDAQLSRLIIVNKMDTDPDQLGTLLEEIQEAFGRRCLPVNLPSEHGKKVVDCFFHEGGGATDFSSVAEAHTRIIDQVVEVDEALMEAYLESGQNLDPQQLHDAFEKALRERHLIPVVFVSAETGAGIEALLDYIVKLMPSPREANPPPFMRGEGEAAEPVVVSSEPDQHVVAHVFKIVVDPYVGRTAVLRVHQGTIRSGAQLFVGDSRKPIKLNHLYRLQGKQNIEVPEAGPGDIVAVTRIDSLNFNDVLHDSHDEDQFHVRLPEMAPPMMGLAIQAAQRGNEQKLSDEYEQPDGYKFVAMTGQGECFPDVTWQLRQVHEVEMTPVDKSSPVGRRVMYLDAQTFVAPRTLIYDRADKLWKSWTIGHTSTEHHLPSNKGKFGAIYDSFSMFDVQNQRCTTGQFRTEIDAGLSPVRMFTPQFMRSGGA